MSQKVRGFALGAALCGVILGGVALARGPDMNLPVFGGTPGSYAPNGRAVRSYYFNPEPEVDAPRVRYEEGERRKPKRSSTVAAFGYGKPVCVRLCDGSFFPASSLAGGEAACAAQCPDAPVALYTMATDRIEDAVSSAGKPYSALPVARKFQSVYEATCTCHRNPTTASRAKEFLNDTTLQKGDVVMTAAGFRVYQGDGYGPTGPGDFLSLSQARVSKEQRATLTAMERASAGSPTRAVPGVLVARPKGNVTVDNGPATP